MEIISTIFAVLFIGFLLVAAFTFSLGLLVIFSTIAIASLVFVVIRNKWQRWQFTRGTKPHQNHHPIIEGQYTEIASKPADNVKE